MFNAFPGPLKLSLTHSANKYINRISGRNKNSASGRINYIFRCGSGKLPTLETAKKKETEKERSKEKEKVKRNSFLFNL